ncbi:MAG: SDR family NAD(P)-dependent oxidoreductase, partial [Myxococcota bacterium]|nr:SDR family NAD(P)-dependent oxidoreductase [Myxococcota bacterium]
IPRDENLQLRDYPTLAHAIQFVKDRAPGAAVASEPSAAPAAVEEAAAETEPSAAGVALTLPAGSLEAARAVARRAPAPVLRPAAADCAPTGVELAASTRVVLMPDAGGVARALKGRLEKRGVTVLELAPAADAETIEDRLDAWRAEGPIHGVYWLPALDSEGEPTQLEPGAWRAALALRVKRLYTAMRRLYDEVAGPDRFLVAATRLGGAHGYDAAGAVAPLGGAVTGFTKAYGRERPETLVKAVDFPATRRTAELADALIEETLCDPGAVEIGRVEGRRLGVALVERPVDDADEPAFALGPDSLAIVTGAAGSIVSAITADLAAAAGGGTFHLLDVAPEPDRGDPDLARFESDRDGLQRAVFERLKAAGERATPARVERELAAIERAHAAAAAMQAIERAGGRAHYHRVDLGDAEAVAKVVGELRNGSVDGRVDLVLHAAGLERSRALPDKAPEEFDRVLDVKCDGWHHLLRALGDAPIGAVVAFSSIAGRFGNAGQTDYSAANDLLCKSVSHLRSTRPGTRALAVDWTAWADIGMAARGSIPVVMERAGIDMLPPDAGIPMVRWLLLTDDGSSEILVGGALGVLEAESHPRGGLAEGALAVADGGPMLGPVAAASPVRGLRVVPELDPTAQPFLDHHRIDGVPVLPGVMGLEGFAEAARLLLPDWHVVALEDVAFQAPFKFYRDAPRPLEVEAQVEWCGDDALAHCRLVGRRALPGREAPQVTEHFRARVRLSPRAPEPETAELPSGPHGAVVDAESVYRVYFHGPAYRVLECAWREDHGAAGRLADPLPDDRTPADSPLCIAPRLVELCFQTAGVHEIGTTGRMGLPTRIARLTLPGAGLPLGPGLCALASPCPAGGYDAVVVDAEGRVRVRLEGYETTGLPVALDEDAAAPLRAAMR